jgi:hypothetical protein
MKAKVETIFAFALLLALLTVFPIVLGQNTDEADVVGVNAGDWVKYKFMKLGPDEIAWSGYKHAVWIKVEVLNVSGNVVKYRETINWDYGYKTFSTISRDVRDVTGRGGYIIGADLELGEKIGEYPISTYKPHPLYVYADLKLNATEFRTYSGVTREVNPVKFSYISPYDVYDVHYTWERYWDKHTGFLLEKKMTAYFLGNEEFGYNETNPESTLIMKIAGTNMWDMETEGSFPWQLLAMTIPVAVVSVAVVVKVRNNRKKNEVREEK